MMVEHMWYKECVSERRFIIKILPGSGLVEHLHEFAKQANVKQAAIVSAVGSVKNIQLHCIKAGANLPVTEPRTQFFEITGPLELNGLQGNIFPDEDDEPNSHFHILCSRSSGEMVGGHLHEAEVFATCEIYLVEFVAAGVERHRSVSGGIDTIYIDSDR